MRFDNQRQSVLYEFFQKKLDELGPDKYVEYLRNKNFKIVDGHAHINNVEVVEVLEPFSVRSGYGGFDHNFINISLEQAEKILVLGLP